MSEIQSVTVVLADGKVLVSTSFEEVDVWGIAEVVEEPAAEVAPEVTPEVAE